jgi:hypothetical protein
MGNIIENELGRRDPGILMVPSQETELKAADFMQRPPRD